MLPLHTVRVPIGKPFVAVLWFEPSLSGPRNLCREAVTAAADGFDMYVMTSRLKRFTQTTDMNVDSSLFYKHVITPNLIK
jgi:hypothetical protein